MLAKTKKALPSSRFRLKALNCAGFHLHFLLPIIAIVAVAGIGTYLLNNSHADPLYGQISGINGECVDTFRDQAVDFNKVELWSCDPGASQLWRYNSKDRKSVV